ncbi:MAG TPA: DUF5132 domain-containing protein, partial [Chloroflexota bacterium]|nr:DUF5132 domain-containing protein [Chloroflexota bacterium]
AAGVGFVLGVSATLATVRQIRPIVREAMKGYLVATERAREATAELGETIEDLYAEAKAQHKGESSPAGFTTAQTPG